MTTTTTRTAPAATSTTGAAGFFNFHASGVGWLNRIRLVKPKRGEEFIACAISALHGRTDEPEHTYLDLRVSGGEAKRLVSRLQKHLEAKRKVFVSFKAGDLFPHIYERTNAGKPETAALIKGRLLALSSISIDGEKVWPVEKPAEAAPPVPEPAPAPVEEAEAVEEAAF